MKEEMMKLFEELIDNYKWVNFTEFESNEECAIKRILASIIKERAEAFIKICDEELKNKILNQQIINQQKKKLIVHMHKRLSGITGPM